MTTYVYNSTDVPKSWGDDSPDDYYSTSTLVVPDSRTITGLRLSMCVTGFSDICGWIALSHPDGTDIYVFAGSSFPWACGDPLPGCGVYGGDIQACTVGPDPYGGLSDLVGKDSAGTWTLLIGGIGGGDCYAAGTLASWSLEIDDDEVAPDPPPDPPICLVGNYAVLNNSVHATFVGLACGQTLTAGSLTRNNAVATLNNIDTDCRRT